MQPDGVLFVDDRRPCYGFLEEKKNKTKGKPSESHFRPG